MILKGRQRRNGADLADHLMNALDNELIEIAEVRGAVAQDLAGAFAEFEAVASGTRAKNYLYSLSINPPEPISREQYAEAIDAIEERLGLSGQPRAVVFHVKDGREHCHVVWSRINASAMKAIHLSHDKSKLMDCACTLAHRFNLPLAPGLRAWEEKQKFEKDKLDATLAEIAQSQKSGVTPEQRREEMTAAYESADTAEAFRAALAQNGYVLAKGDRRAFVVVDEQCDVHSLTRYVKGHKARDIKAKLATLDLDDLPSVDQAKELIRSRAQQQAQSQGDAAGANDLAKRQRLARMKLLLEQRLAKRQEARRVELDAKEQALLTRQQDERLQLHAAQLREGRSLLYRARRAVAELIGQTPGLRSVLAPIQRLTGLDPKERHKLERSALLRRHGREKADIARQRSAFARLQNREAKALKAKLDLAQRKAQELKQTASQEFGRVAQQEVDRDREQRAARDLRDSFNDAGKTEDEIDQIDDSGDGDDLRMFRSGLASRIRSVRRLGQPGKGAKRGSKNL